METASNVNETEITWVNSDHRSISEKHNVGVTEIIFPTTLIKGILLWYNTVRRNFTRLRNNNYLFILVWRNIYSNRIGRKWLKMNPCLYCQKIKLLQRQSSGDRWLKNPDYAFQTTLNLFFSKQAFITFFLYSVWAEFVMFRIPN